MPNLLLCCTVSWHAYMPLFEYKDEAGLRSQGRSLFPSVSPFPFLVFISSSVPTFPSPSDCVQCSGARIHVLSVLTVRVLTTAEKRNRAISATNLKGSSQHPAASEARNNNFRTRTRQCSNALQILEKRSLQYPGTNLFRPELTRSCSAAFAAVLLSN